MRKKAKKVTVHRRKTSRSHSSSFEVNYLAIVFSLFLLVVASYTTLKLYRSPRVLGATAGPILLARGGDDTQTSGGGLPPMPPSTTSDENETQPSGERGMQQAGVATVPSTSTSDNSLVLCVGPDNKQFKTELKNCKTLNTSNNHSVQFTPLTKQTNMMARPSQDETEMGTSEANMHKPLRIKTEDNKSIEVSTNGTQIKIETKGNKTIVNVQKPDGTESEVDETDALKKVNDLLKDKDVSIATSGGNLLNVQNGGVVAHTQLPLSIDPTTNQLIVTTKAGTKTVAVLPQQAVNNLLSKGIISSVQTESANGEASLQPVQSATLTEDNGEAVFKISGVSQKKVFGIFSVAIPKTVTTSAETGQVTNVDESFLSKLLETVSF